MRDSLNGIGWGARSTGSTSAGHRKRLARINPRAANGWRVEACLALLAVVAAVMAALPAAASSGCELLPPVIVSSVAGEAVQLDSTALRDPAGRSVCRYIGKAGIAFTLSVLSLESEGAARAALQQELARVFGASSQGELLRGVGAEARIGVPRNARDNTVVARHGVTVFVLSGHTDQERLVLLARSIIARLERA